MINGTRDQASQDQASRDAALAQLKKRRDFRGHVLVFVLVNTFLVTMGHRPRDERVGCLLAARHHRG